MPVIHTMQFRAKQTGVNAVGTYIHPALPGLSTLKLVKMIMSLKPSGYLIVQSYTPKQREFATGGLGVIANLYTGDLLRSTFSDLQIENTQV